MTPMYEKISLFDIRHFNSEVIEARKAIDYRKLIRGFYFLRFTISSKIKDLTNNYKRLL